MGLAIGKAIDCIDGTDAAKHKMRAKMLFLQKTGKNHTERFFQEVSEDNDPTRFKIGKTLEKYAASTIMTAEHSSQLKKTVENIVHGVVKSIDEAEIIIAVVVGAIDGMLDQKIEGESIEKKVYTVRLEGLSLHRIDIFLHQCEFSAKGMIADYESLFVYAYTVSTIGQKITKQDLEGFISEYVPDVDKHGKKLSPEELTDNQIKMFNKIKPFIELTPED